MKVGLNKYLTLITDETNLNDEKIKNKKGKVQKKILSFKIFIPNHFEPLSIKQKL